MYHTLTAFRSDIILLLTQPTKIQEIKIKWSKAFLIIFFLVIIHVTWAYFITHNNFWVGLRGDFTQTEGYNLIKSSLFMDFIIGCITIPIIEEFTFRYPLKFNDRKAFLSVFIAFSIVSNLIFGKVFKFYNIEFIVYFIAYITLIPMLIELTLKSEIPEIHIKRFKNNKIVSGLLTFKNLLLNFNEKVLFGFIKPRLGGIIVIISTILFACIHLTNYDLRSGQNVGAFVLSVLIAYLPLSLAYPYLRLKFINGLIYSMILHVAYNSSILILSQFIS